MTEIGDVPDQCPALSPFEALDRHEPPMTGDELDLDDTIERVQTSDRVSEAGAVLLLLGYGVLIATGEASLASAETGAVATALSLLGYDAVGDRNLLPFGN